MTKKVIVVVVALSFLPFLLGWWASNYGFGCRNNNPDIIGYFAMVIFVIGLFWVKGLTASRCNAFGGLILFIFLFSLAMPSGSYLWPKHLDKERIAYNQKLLNAVQVQVDCYRQRWLVLPGRPENKKEYERFFLLECRVEGYGEYIKPLQMLPYSWTPQTDQGKGIIRYYIGDYSTVGTKLICQRVFARAEISLQPSPLLSNSQ